MRKLVIAAMLGLLAWVAQPAFAADEPHQSDRPSTAHAAARRAAESPEPAAEAAQEPAEPSSEEPADSSPQPADSFAEQATHREVDPLPVAFKELSALGLQVDGTLLACDAGAAQIKLISPEGKLRRTIEPGFAPEAIDVGPDGAIYCAGQGRLAKLDPQGRVLKAIDLPKPDAADGPAAAARMGFGRANHVSGIAISGKDLFVAYGAGWSLRSRSKLFRYTSELEDPQLIAEDLRGCCQRCDIVAREGVIYVAENAAYRVVCLDREGNVLSKWGAKSRTGLAGFGACCNPMNLYFDAKGGLYTSESGLGRVKCYTTGGELLGLVGYVDVQRFQSAGALAASCSNMALAVTPDGGRVYVMDYKGNMIRVLEKKD